jgi:hypothetical protein
MLHFTPQYLMLFWNTQSNENVYPDTKGHEQADEHG